jgi:AAA domain
MKLARGLAHEAAVFKKQAAALWEILDTASCHAPNYDEEDNRRRFQRYIDEAFNRENPITIATVFDLARKHGWLGWSPPVMATASVPMVWSAADMNVSFANVPHRHWLYGTYLIRGEITVVAAPGGAGKTAFSTGVATEIARAWSFLGRRFLETTSRFCSSMPKMAARERLGRGGAGRLVDSVTDRAARRNRHHRRHHEFFE